MIVQRVAIFENGSTKDEIKNIPDKPILTKEDLIHMFRFSENEKGLFIDLENYKNYVVDWKKCIFAYVYRQDTLLFPVNIQEWFASLTIAQKDAAMEIEENYRLTRVRSAL